MRWHYRESWNVRNVAIEKFPCVAVSATASPRARECSDQSGESGIVSLEMYVSRSDVVL